MARNNSRNSNSQKVSGFSFGRDVFGFQTPTMVEGEQAGQNTWGIDSVEDLEDGRGYKVGWHLDLKTLHGGLNKTRGEWPRHGHRVAQSWLDTRWPDMVIPNLAHVAGGGATPANNRHGLHWTNIEMQQLITGLVSYWRGEDGAGNNAADAYGSNTLTQVNSPGSVAAKQGNGRSHTRASSHRFNIADNASLSLGDGVPFSFGGWVRFTTLGNRMDFFGKLGGAANEFTCIMGTDSLFSVQMWDTTNTQRVYSISDFGTASTATWYHYVVTFDGTTVRAYINGSLQFSSTTLVGGIQDSTGALQLGAASSANHLDGDWDEWFFAKRCYTASEVERIYNGDLGLAFSDWQAYRTPHLIIGSGGGANVSLLRETSHENAALTPITYSPGTTTPITSIQSLITGGISNAARLVIGHYNDAPDVVSDANGTIDGTMDTGWNSLWAMFQTTLPDIPLLGYAGTSLKTLLATDAIGTAPTTVLSNIPGGGYGVGIIARGGGRLRAYFVRPKANLANGMLLYGSEQPGIVFHVNQEGTDPQDMTPSDWLGMTDIIHAIPYEDGILATDGKRIVFNADYVKRDYGIFYDRDIQDANIPTQGGTTAMSINNLRVLALGTNGAAIRALVRGELDDNLVPEQPYSAMWIEEWSPLTGSWHCVSELIAPNTPSIGTTIITPVGGIPHSLTTEYDHWYAPEKDSWYRQPVAPYGVNPLSYYRGRTNAFGDVDGKNFASGELLLPKLRLPDGLDGWPSTVVRIIPTAPLYAGGAGSSATFSGGGKSHSLAYDDGKIEDGVYWKVHQPFEQNDSMFFELQPGLSWTPGDRADLPASLLPVRIEGYTYVGVKPEALEAEGLRMPEGGASR